jgi:hypothetical protein
MHDFDEALLYFRKIQNFAPKSIDELRLVQHLFSYKRYYEEFNFWLDKELEWAPNNRTQIEVRKRIHEVEPYVLSNQWTNDSIMFPELKLIKSLKIANGSQTYLDEVVPIIEAYDFGLRVETTYETSGNQALAIAFHEFGAFLFEKLSVTDAFIALSVGRYYDKLNFELTETYRMVRSEMNRRKLVFPSMRRYFPKQNQGIFSPERIEKRRLKREEGENTEMVKPYFMALETVSERSVLSNKLGSIIVLIGLILLVLYVIFFVKISE